MAEALVADVVKAPTHFDAAVDGVICFQQATGAAICLSTAWRLARLPAEMLAFSRRGIYVRYASGRTLKHASLWRLHSFSTSVSHLRSRMNIFLLAARRASYGMLGPVLGLAAVAVAASELPSAARLGPPVGRTPNLAQFHRSREILAWDKGSEEAVAGVLHSKSWMPACSLKGPKVQANHMGCLG